MSFRQSFYLVTAFAVMTTGGGRSIEASDVSISTLCLSAAQSAANESGVPLEILLALTQTETGRGGPDGKFHPWPWSLNHAGKSLWFSTREDALDYLKGGLADGSRNIDVGCFQLNVRWHAQEFASAEDMIDPVRNARYAAGFLADLFRKTGDWTAAVASYHSSDPERADLYLDRFMQQFQLVTGGEAVPLPDVASHTAPQPQDGRQNAYPLLQAGLSAGVGSLVPMISGQSPIIGR